MKKIIISIMCCVAICDMSYATAQNLAEPYGAQIFLDAMDEDPRQMYEAADSIICPCCDLSSVRPVSDTDKKEMGKCPIFIPITLLVIAIVLLFKVEDGGCLFVGISLFFLISSIFLFFSDVDLNSFAETSKHLFEEWSYTY